MNRARGNRAGRHLESQPPHGPRVARGAQLHRRARVDRRRRGRGARGDLHGFRGARAREVPSRRERRMAHPGRIQPRNLDAVRGGLADRGALAAERLRERQPHALRENISRARQVRAAYVRSRDGCVGPGVVRARARRARRPLNYGAAASAARRGGRIDFQPRRRPRGCCLRRRIPRGEVARSANGEARPRHRQGPAYTRNAIASTTRDGQLHDRRAASDRDPGTFISTTPGNRR